MKLTLFGAFSAAAVFGVSMAAFAQTTGQPSGQPPSTTQTTPAAPQMPTGIREMKAASGTMVLTDAKGMTLYTFAKDQPGVSNCNDNCAKNWPPLTAAADAKPMGEWAIVTRADGTKQWAYKGMPLYTWIKDMKPGETSGEGVGGGTWKVAVR
jgi:predicted lipoprotein with Yx(FWY)xxD motif